MRLASTFVLISAATACGSPPSASRDASIDSALDAADARTGDAPSPPPTIPVGLDAFRMWDRWPYIRLGARTYMRSTYDRAGGNEAADAAHFIRVESATAAVPLDVVGRGVAYFARANHWHGSPWHYTVDHRDTVVTETNTATPDAPVPNAVFAPAAAFPPPLALTSTITAGADINAVPMPFTDSFEITYERTFYGTGYFIYSLFADDAMLSQPLAPWTAAPPDADVLALLSRAGSDIAPTGPGVRVDSGTVSITPTNTTPVLDLAGPAVIRALTFTVPAASALAFGRAELRITWDDRAAPSVDAPIALFHGAGTLFNRSGAEYLVRSLPAVIHFTGSNVTLATYFPMPFQSHAHIEIVGTDSAIPNVAWQVRSVPFADAPNAVGYFHASYVDHGTPVPGNDLVLLDTTRTEGGGDWCGSFVGTSVIFSDQAVLATLEGDPRFFFDDSMTPQAQGTGTEEWGGGGDYWGGVNTTLAFFGHPVGAPDPSTAMNSDDLVESMYRFLLADLFPFGRNARIQLEHGGTDDSTEHYRTVTYWYGRPQACLTLTDSFHVGDAADETLHAYTSPDASDVQTLTSRYELGVDTFAGVEIYPATTDTGRYTNGTSEFTLSVDRDNVGVLLRRKLDYGFSDQRAEVSVADDTPGASFVSVGTWYLAGSNVCAFSEATTETGTSSPIIESSNRRFRDDEFLLPGRVTAGRASIRVRVANTTVSQPVAPGASGPGGVWSELRYTAYSYVY